MVSIFFRFNWASISTLSKVRGPLSRSFLSVQNSKQASFLPKKTHPSYPLGLLHGTPSSFSFSIQELTPKEKREDTPTHKIFDLLRRRAFSTKNVSDEKDPKGQEARNTPDSISSPTKDEQISSSENLKEIVTKLASATSQATSVQWKAWFSTLENNFLTNKVCLSFFQTCTHLLSSSKPSLLFPNHSGINSPFL